MAILLVFIELTLKKEEADEETKQPRDIRKETKSLEHCLFHKVQPALRRLCMG